jgi:hypothetical protein
VRIASGIVLLVLILLAVLSGFTKVALLEQDVNFFGRYGFSNSLLVSYGLTQIAGGVLMILEKTRFIGAAIVAITFLISLVVLVMDGNIPVSIVTAVAILLLGVIMKQSAVGASKN